MQKQDFPLVSVVIPAYNHESYVQKSLDSVAEQDYPNKEIIVINDGSMDETMLKIETWIQYNKFTQITFKNQSNAGIATTLNRLLELASGEYIALASSDDYLLPRSLSKRIERLQKVNKKAIFGDCIVINENEKKIHNSVISGLYDGNKKLLKSEKHLKSQILRKFSVAGPAILFHRSILSSEENFDPNLLVEDWDFCLKLAVKHELAFVDYPVGAYRLHKSNTINRENSVLDGLSYEEKIYNKYKNHFVGEDLKFINRRLREISFKRFKIKIRTRSGKILKRFLGQ